MINKYMYAVFLGLYLMNEKIPHFIIRYVHSHRPDSVFGKVWLALSTLAGAPNMYDDAVRQLVLAALA